MRSDYMVGVFLLVASAVTFSSAGLFTKGVVASAWAVIFWRGLFAAILTTAWVGQRGALRQELVEMGKSGLAVGVIGAIGTAAFIPAFKLTSIANVALIYAVAPMIAAALAWLWMRERMGDAL
ncbi:MAG: DMT family transporter [Cognatishimia sp.]|nr:DMT family transporter [Cognatishimia sp.]